MLTKLQYISTRLHGLMYVQFYQLFVLEFKLLTAVNGMAFRKFWVLMLSGDLLLSVAFSGFLSFHRGT